MTSGRMLGPTLGALLALSVASPMRGERAPRKDAYVLARGEHFAIASGTIDDLKAARRRYSGDFLWASRSGRAYVIRDPELLARGLACFDGLEETAPARRALEDRQRDLESKRQALDRERQALERESDAAADEDAEEASEARSANGQSRRAIEAKGRELDSRERELDSRERELDARERDLEAAERKIDRRDDELEREGEARLWRLIDRAIADGTARPASD
jgi:DNA repair exonuclease SbcCD ATPase subunit